MVVEADITNSNIDKNHLYASIGVPAFWRFDGDIWQIFILRDSSYVEVSHSPTFDGIEKEDLYRFLEEARINEVETEIEFRSWVREKRSDLN